LPFFSRHPVCPAIHAPGFAWPRPGFPAIEDRFLPVIEDAVPFNHCLLRLTLHPAARFPQIDPTAVRWKRTRPCSRCAPARTTRCFQIWDAFERVCDVRPAKAVMGTAFNRKETTMSKKTKTRPVETLRDGAIKAAIWRNESENGDFFSVTFARTYKDSQGDLQDTDSFSGTQLLRLARLAEKAYDRTAKLTKEARAKDDENDEGEEA
jgi:hypothetical protein